MIFKATQFTLASFILLLSFSISAEIIESDGRTYQFNKGFYAVANENTEQSNRMQANSAQSQTNTQDDSFFLFGNFRVYQNNLSNQNSATQSTNQSRSTTDINRREVLINTANGMPAVVFNIFVKFKTKSDLDSFLNQNLNLNLLNTFEKTNLAVVAPTQAGVSTVETYQQLKEQFERGFYPGIERINLSLLTNPKAPN